MVGWLGLEPRTNGLKGQRSTRIVARIYRESLNINGSVAFVVANKFWSPDNWWQ